MSLVKKNTTDGRVEQFVPQGVASLQSDAPGWENTNNTEPTTASDGVDLLHQSSSMVGPTCWKCSGVGRLRGKSNKRKVCGVCNGNGCIRSLRQTATDSGGVITSGRRPLIMGWTPFGPLPHALSQMNQDKGDASSTDYDTETLPGLLSCLANANEEKVDVTVPHNDEDDQNNMPLWRPHPGEQLCNLVGQWRILQRVKSHRWTTDDLCTAYIASKHVGEAKNYMDLGTGNASVLQMVLWHALQKNGTNNNNNHSTASCLQAVGVEARSEAVELARRSLSFNLGPSSKSSMQHTLSAAEKYGRDVSAHVIHSDFRDLQAVYKQNKNADQNDTLILRPDLKKLKGTHPDGFDLVTGTPPYFRVDFQLESTSLSLDGETDKEPQERVTRAVIRQGGMPTAIQSAPARCEFRGGVEAYIETAACLQGKTLVVCENWLNHPRVHAAAKLHGYHISHELHVHGKAGRGTLFAVYTLVFLHQTPSIKNDNVSKTTIETLIVRQLDGNYTPEYANVLESMSIPAKTK